MHEGCCYPRGQRAFAWGVASGNRLCRRGPLHSSENTICLAMATDMVPFVPRLRLGMRHGGSASTLEIISPRKFSPLYCHASPLQGEAWQPPPLAASSATSAFALDSTTCVPLPPHYQHPMPRPRITARHDTPAPWNSCLLDVSNRSTNPSALCRSSGPKAQVTIPPSPHGF